MNYTANEILVPGGLKQFEQLSQLNKKFEKILIVGEALELVAKKISKKFNSATELIMEDYSALINSKLALGENSGIIPKIMEYDRTDFPDAFFDVVFSQASISRENRKRIVKEIGRILKSGGIFSVGEITMRKNPLPRMIQDMLDWAGIVPLPEQTIEEYYAGKGFEIIHSQNLPEALPDYYKKIEKLFKRKIDELNEREKSYYKKLINRISHEANVFLKFGGEKYLSFHILLAKKL